MDYRFSEKMSSIHSSATVTLAEKARMLKERGEAIIDLTIGEPDFPTPTNIIKAAFEGMNHGDTKYTSSRGITSLRNAIAKKMERDHGLSYDPQYEIIVTPGGKQGVMYSILSFINPGDEVLCIEPCWVGYESCIQLAGGKYVGVPTYPENGYGVDEKVLRSKISPRSRMLFINSPCNPTGKVLTEDEIRMIAKICVEKNLILVTDDIYEKIIYDGRKFISPAGYPGMRERTIVLNGFSKAYAMTGWRLAYLAGDKLIIDQMNKLQQLSATCPSSISQVAGVEALTGDQSSVVKMLDAYQRRRDIVFVGFNNSRFSCFKAEGAFYAFIDIRKLNMNSAQASEFLLEKCKIVAVPGNAFGEAGEGFVRISFAASDDQLKKAVESVAKV